MADSINASIVIEGADALKTLASIDKGLKNLEKSGTKSIGTIDKAFASFVGNVGAGLVLRGLDLTAQAFKQGAKDALNFGAAVAEINSIAPRTAVETLALKQQLIGLSNAFGSDAQKQAKAFYNIVSAGVQGTSKQLEVLEVANKAATAGLVDINDSARVLVASVNSYAASGLTATQASDILFNTVREGITTYGELSNSLGRVTPLAAAAGVKFSEVGGTLAFLTKQGISTNEATTGLRAILASIVKPSAEAQEQAKLLGIEFNSAAIQSKGFAGFLGELIQRTGGSQEKLAKLFGGVEALNPVLAIAKGNFADFNRILNETANASGATDKALEQITNNADFQFKKLQTQLSNFPTAILTNFEEPLVDALKIVNEFVSEQGILVIADAIDGIISGFQGINSAVSETQQFFNFITGTIFETAKAWSEFVLAVVDARIATQEFIGVGVGEELKKEQANLKLRIAVLDETITVNQAATVKLQQEEQKRFDAAQGFRNKIAEARKKELEDIKNRDKEKLDQQVIAQELEAQLAAEGEQKKFDLVQELKNLQKENETAKAEEEKLAKQLANEESFLLLEEQLGREQALRELVRIKDIDDEKKRLDALKVLRDKADKEQRSGILQLRKFEDLSNTEKVAAQRETLAAIATLSQNSTGALFAIGKAASISLAGINVAEGVTKALSAFPPPFNFAAAASVGAAGAIQIAKIASAKPPSAGNFAEGGVVGGNSFSGDRLQANVNSGEVILNQRQIGNVFKAIDEGSLGGGGGIVINSPVFLNEQMVDDVIDRINDRVEFGNKRLISSGVA